MYLALAKRLNFEKGIFSLRNIFKGTPPSFQAIWNFEIVLINFIAISDNLEQRFFFWPKFRPQLLLFCFLGWGGEGVTKVQLLVLTKFLAISGNLDELYFSYFWSIFFPAPSLFFGEGGELGGRWCWWVVGGVDQL